MENNLILDYSLEFSNSVYTSNRWPMFSYKWEEEPDVVQLPISAISLQVRSNQNSTMSSSLNYLAVHFYANLFNSTTLNLHYSYFLYYRQCVNKKLYKNNYNIWNYYSNEMIDGLSEKCDYIYFMDDHTMYTGLIRIEQNQLDLIGNPKMLRGMLMISANLSVSRDSLLGLDSLMDSGIMEFYRNRICEQNDIILQRMNEYDYLNYAEMTFFLSNQNLMKYFEPKFDLPE